MRTVITYGTFDLLHEGHRLLLKRAKLLGDFLIVGITADDFDKSRGKINSQQSLMERIEAVKALEIADEIIIEEYEGQKIDDIKKYNVDVFTVGSDWAGKFDYLQEFCEVVYLPRTEGISSTDLRGEKRKISIGLVGESLFINKIEAESRYVDGLIVEGICSANISILSESVRKLSFITDDYNELLARVEAVYIRSNPENHYKLIKSALSQGKHVLCEAPIALTSEENKELYAMAKEKNLVLMDAIKTAYATAYERLLLLVKTGKIGKVVSVDATCTSLNDVNRDNFEWSCLYEWGPTALLPILQMLGTNDYDKRIVSRFSPLKNREDFVKIDFLYTDAVATLKISDGVKSEGELIVSGTEGYIYVPAPWWKTDYFEIRYENSTNNKRYFYPLDGEGIRHELIAFLRAIETGKDFSQINKEVSSNISEIMQDFSKNKIEITQ